MGKVKRGPTAQSVSPYLTRPLRSLAQALAGRKSTEDTALHASKSSLRAEAQSAPRASRGASTAAD